MTIDIRYATTQSNKPVPFDFDGTVIDYVVGIAYWDMEYDHSDHQTQTIAMKVTSSKNAKTVTATPTATLDGEGHSLGSNSICLCCIAVIDGADSNVSLATVTGLASGSQSSGISTPTSSASQSFIAGWSAQYSKSHHVKSFQTTAGVESNGSDAQITATVSMQDNSGHTAVNPTLDACLLAIGPHEKGLVSAEVDRVQSSRGVPVTMPVAVNRDKVAVMLKDFEVSYQHADHDIARIWGGAPGWTVSQDGKTVTLNSAMAQMHDDDPLGGHNTQDNSQSHVSLVVYGIPS